jgi:uncharacterized membrane protein YdjX (TVP38/TMEM64 family)
MISRLRSDESSLQRSPQCRQDEGRCTARSVGRLARTVGRWLPWLLVGAVAALGLWSWYSGGLVFDLLRQDWDAAAKVSRLKAFFDDCGTWAPLVYVALVAVEVVVAPIPGLMLYAPGGLIFGPVLGGALALAGNVIGAGAACSLVRSLAIQRAQRWASSQRIERLQAALGQRGSWLIFLLRLNPLTSSDLVSYAAGLTRIPVWKVMLATACGMAPLCFAQSSLSHGLFHAFPGLIYPLLAACGIYLLIVVAVLRRLLAADRCGPGPEDATPAGALDEA